LAILKDAPQIANVPIHFFPKRVTNVVISPYVSSSN
jgi:hypothetical protein